MAIRNGLRRCLLLLSLTLTLTLLPNAWGADGGRDGIAVIVPPAGLAIPFDMLNLRDVFLRRIAIDQDGRPIIPLNLPPDNPLRRAFSLALLGATPQSLQNYWNERYFHGISPPHVLDSPEAMLRFVAKTPGAIGYVAACQTDTRVKVAMVLPVPPRYRDAVAVTCPAPPSHAGH